MADDVQQLAERVGAVERGVAGLTTSVRTEFDRVNQRFGVIDQRFTEIDRRFDHVDQRFNQLEAAIVEQRRYTEFAYDQLGTRMDAGFARVDERFDQMDGRFERLERKLDQFTDRVVPPRQPPAE